MLGQKWLHLMGCFVVVVVMARLLLLLWLVPISKVWMIPPTGMVFVGGKVGNVVPILIVSLNVKS
jgi:hypothetical protein